MQGFLVNADVVEHALVMAGCVVGIPTEIHQPVECLRGLCGGIGGALDSGWRAEM